LAANVGVGSFADLPGWSGLGLLYPSKRTSVN
jgi:hypothetical protein